MKLKNINFEIYYSIANDIPDIRVIKHKFLNNQFPTVRDQIYISVYEIK